MNHEDIFESLTRNAFDFLERGIAEFDASPKYSVIHFCAAVEMLLKARLLKEHWSAPRRLVWNPTITMVGRSRGRWACGQGAKRLVHMSTGRH